MVTLEQLRPGKKRRFFGRKKTKRKRKLIGEGFQARVYRKNRRTVSKEFKRYPIYPVKRKFRSELKAMQRLKGTGVAPRVRGAGDRVIDMEYVRGKSITQKVGDNKRRQKRYGRQLGKKIAVMHKRGVAHRDLHGGNVLVTGGNVKVLDYGHAKVKKEVSAKDKARDLNRIINSHKDPQYSQLRESILRGYVDNQ